MNNLKTEKYTLKELLKKYDTIEVPILQRDYAQGRQTEKSIRNAFVNYLSVNLADKNPIELDFVYGALQEKTFIPLDGQQRLTTLWLLHWFLAIKDNALSDEVKEILRRFKYETRPMALSFCKKLLNLEISTEKLPTIKEYLTDQNWFDEAWKQNATVSGMLTMLQTFAEDKKLEKVSFDDLWNQDLVSFYFLPIENFGLTDELYIRMNARGEKLTNYEHFKSEFYKTIQSHPKVEEIKSKMDKEWVENLWDFRKKEVFVTDEVFINYLSFLNKMQFYTQSQAEYKEKEDEEFRALEFNSDFYKDNQKTDFLNFAFDAISILKQIEYQNILKGKSFKDILKELLQEAKAGTDECFIIYSALIYIQKHQLNAPDEKLLEFIRVIRNLIVNTADKGVREWSRTLPSVAKMAEKTSVYDFLLTKEKEIIGFRTDQKEEEICKAKIIQQNSEYKSILFELEDTNFCIGKIKLAFVVSEFKPENISSFDPDLMTKIKKVFEEHFSGEDITNDFRRALFTIDDNEFYKYWNSYYYAAQAPKYCMIENITDLKNFTYEENRRNTHLEKYIKKLVFLLTDKKLEDIIDDFIKNESFCQLPQWKQRLIKEPKLLEHSKKHYIAIKQDKSCCWLIPASKTSNDTEGLKKCKKIQ